MSKFSMKKKKPIYFMIFSYPKITMPTVFRLKSHQETNEEFPIN
jgi:hypothetical protein